MIGLLPSLAESGVEVDELQERRAGGGNAGFEDHAVGDFVEAGEAGGGFATVVVVEDALQVSDDGEGVVKLENASFNLAGIERGEGAAEIAKNCVVQRDDQSDGRGAGERWIAGRRRWRSSRSLNEFLEILCDAGELLAKLRLQERKLLEGGVDLRIDQDEVGLFGVEGVLEVGDGLREGPRRLRKALGIESERTDAGGDETIESVVEVRREAGGGRLKEVLHVGIVAGKLG